MLPDAPEAKATTNVSKARIHQDKDMYKDLTQGLKCQLADHEMAAAARRGERPHADSRTFTIEERDIPEEPVPQNITTATDFIELYRLPRFEEVISTRELLENIISALDAEDILNARLVNRFCKDTVGGLARLQSFRRQLRQELFLEPIDIGPVERVTAMSRYYTNPQCTSSSRSGIGTVVPVTISSGVSKASFKRTSLHSHKQDTPQGHLAWTCNVPIEHVP